MYKSIEKILNGCEESKCVVLRSINEAKKVPFFDDVAVLLQEVYSESEILLDGGDIEDFTDTIIQDRTYEFSIVDGESDYKIIKVNMLSPLKKITLKEQEVEELEGLDIILEENAHSTPEYYSQSKEKIDVKDGAIYQRILLNFENAENKKQFYQQAKGFINTY